MFYRACDQFYVESLIKRYQSSVNKLTSTVRDDCRRDAEQAYNVFPNTILVPSRIRVLTTSTPGVKVNTRRCLGEETPSTNVAKRKRRQGEPSPRWRRRPTKASPRSNIIKSRQSQRSSPIPMGRKDHGGSGAVGRPQVPIIRGSDKEKEKVASRP